jgi:hypothetical protein
MVTDEELLAMETLVDVEEKVTGRPEDEDAERGTVPLEE